MSLIRQSDIFASAAGETVFANVNPAVGDVIYVRKNFLVENDLIGFARVMNRINRTFSGGFDRRDMNIDRIQAIIHTLRQIPLRGASGRGGARLGVTHDAALRTARKDIQPAINGTLYKIHRAIIHYQA